MSHLNLSYNMPGLARRRVLLYLLLATCSLGYQNAKADTFTVLHTFTGHNSTTPANSDGKNPIGGLYQASDGYLYGTTAEGGGISTPAYENGTVFKISTNGSNYQILWDFPEMTIDLAYSGVHYYSYLAIYGKRPTATLIQDSTGQLCGTTTDGGFDAIGGYDTPVNPHYANQAMGTVFRLTPGGSTPEDFVSFSRYNPACNGSAPSSAVLAGSGGYFYGTDPALGYPLSAYNASGGAVFRSSFGTSSGSGTIDYLYTFSSSPTSATGNSPRGSLLTDASGNLFGVTYYGGTNQAGTIYKLTKPAGTTTPWPLTVLHTLNGTDGSGPASGLLYYPVDGTYYGITSGGGVTTSLGSGAGTIFKMDSSGNFLDAYGTVIPAGTGTLHTFVWSDELGINPNSTPILGSDGNFYGTTAGTYTGYPWYDLKDGTIYRLTPSGIVSLIHTFGPSDGGYNSSGGAIGGFSYNLIQGSDGALYGTTPNEVYRCQLDSEAALQVSGGHVHSIGLMTGGTVWSWGDNTYGQLGDGTLNDNKNPVQVLTAAGTPLTGITAVTAGSNHNLALKSDGTVWTWGSNANGQLGNNSTTDSLYAVQVVDATGTPLSGITAVAAGASHSVALKSDGTVWSWGRNSTGQLGTGTTAQSLVPVQTLTSTGMAHAFKIYACGNSTAAVASFSTVYTWGSNANGQLGDGTTTSRTSPTHITSLDTAGGVSVSTLSVGYNHMLAKKTDGTVWSWGDNTYGQLGNGTTTGSSSPLQVPGLSSITAVFAGTYNSRCMGASHYTYGWGNDAYGQVGDGTSGSGVIQTSPVHVTALDAASGVYVTSLNGGGYFGLAIRNNGTVVGWGQNLTGQLGNGKAAGTQVTPVKTIGFLAY